MKHVKVHVHIARECITTLSRTHVLNFSLPNPFEERMKSLQFVPLRRLNRSKKRRTLSDEPDYGGQGQGDTSPACAKNKMTETKEGITLPPLVSKGKVQGPFRRPEEVQRQRAKPLSPTLRVATSYNSVEMAS